MKYRYIIILAFLAACNFLSCKKELNVFPTTSEVDGNVIIDEKSAEAVLNGVYYRFADAGTYNNSPTVFWTNVNEIMPSEFTGSLINSGGDDNFYTFTFNPKTPEVDLIWNYGYNLVNAANGFIKNIAPVTSIPPPVKREMIGEARFLRAFGDAELLLYYGQYNNPQSKYGIVLRNEFVTATNIDLPRSDVATTYTAILADLDTAISVLPAAGSQVTAASASAAKLLKARMLINRGAPGDYQQVIDLTNDLITNGPFALEANLKNIFLSKGFKSKEVILGVQPYATQNYKFEANQEYNQFLISDSLASMLTNDPRSQWYYKTITNFAGPLRTLTKYYSGNPVNISQTPLSEYGYAFRLTEAYLLEAEAITLSGGDLSVAKALLTTVESHAGITDLTAVNNANTPADLQFLIVEEEIKNFAFENGTDWFALRRLPFATIQQLQPAIRSADQLILPIPFSETSVNINVIQNPGY